MKELSIKQARKFILHHQFLAQQKLKGKAGTMTAIEQISYVQIDTISVVARAHHHVLWTRVSNYENEFLAKLEAERKIFDYWAHAASYLPMHDYRFSLYRKKEYEIGNGLWYQKEPKLMAEVLDKFKAEGALMSRDFQKGDFDESGTPWAHHPINRALRQLFMDGKIMISGRKGFQKIFDLPERILPDSVNREMPSKSAYYKHLIRRDIQAQGIIKAREIGYLLKKFDRPFLKELLNKMVLEDELTVVKIKGIDEFYFAFSEALNKFSSRSSKAHFHILSPFDNLIIQRKRLSDLFNFNYTIECYVPAAKRKVGYFSLPLLYGTDFIGQIDLKADRNKKELLIKNLVWENGYQLDESTALAFKQKLADFAKFNDCDMIKEIEI